MNSNGVLNASNGHGVGKLQQNGASQHLNVNMNNMNAESAVQAAKQIQNGDNPTALLQGNMNGQVNGLGNGQTSALMNG